MDVASSVVVDRQAQDWLPHTLAAGPFGGVHGGVVAACLLTAISEQQETKDRDLVVLNAQLLRAPELKPFTVDVETIRTGRRTGALSATLRQQGKAMASATFASVVEVPDLDVQQPESLPGPSENRVGSGPWSLQMDWFWRVFDVRLDAPGGFWFRPKVELIAGAPPTATLIAIADWASGLFRPDRMGPRRVAAWLNAELTVHLPRPASAIDATGWFGVAGSSAWNGLGWGFTGATLRDPTKLLGRSAQACTLTPAETSLSRSSD